MSEAKSLLSRADELNSVGAKLFGQNQMEPARLHFLAALGLEPNHAQALQNLGAVLRTMGHHVAAEAISHRSVVASGNNVYCRSNLGVSQLNLKKYQEALKTLRQVAVELPDAPHSWHNLGLALYMVGKYNEAIFAFNKTLALQPDNLAAQSDRALALLALGQIQEGLAAYEVRWKLLPKNEIWSLGVPEWQGESLWGCRILLHHEQGFGDSLMLSRFATDLKRDGTHVTLAVPEELKSLFARSFKFIKVVGFESDAEFLANAANFDFHSPLLSLMRHLKIAKPLHVERIPYLTSKPRTDLNLPNGQIRIGICWASGDHAPELRDRRRVVPLSLFIPLLQTPNLSLISLQKGPDSKAISHLGLEGLIHDLNYRMVDFDFTASVIAELDLVISVDSAVAHLAGALGKRCIMLSPYTRCWRWWGQDLGYPWYERMSVFSQSENGTWNKAVRSAIRAALRATKARD